MSMQANLDLYNQIKADLLQKDMAGQFVLIHNGELVDVYPTYQEAFNAAVAKFGTAQVLIQKVEAQDSVETI